MEKHDKSELRIIEVKGSLPVQQARKPALLMPQRSAPTRAEVLEALRSMKGAASVIERIPALGDITAWGETAFWGVNNAGGAALHLGALIWKCDCPGESNLAFSDLNNVVTFWGTEQLLAPPGEVVTPPQSLCGKVWCELDLPDGGYYLFVAQVEANGDPPDYVASIECGIDALSFGQIQLFAFGPLEQFFLLELSAGFHRFFINQVSGIFHFRTLTAWHIPVLQQ